MTYRCSLLGVGDFCFAAVGCIANEQAADANPPAASRETLSLDQGWRFHLGDIPLKSFPGGQGIALYGPDFTHSGAKAGHTWGAAARGFNDQSWRQVNLPPDWAVEQPFDQNAEKQQGYRPRGIGWYRRMFKLDPADRGKNIELQFDGVATHCAVYLNGTPVAHNFCGYTSFYIDVTPMARYGDDLNTIAVRVDAEARDGWWYEGAGIYRHTWLVKRSPLPVVTDGVYANPVKGPDGKWTIPAEVTLASDGFQFQSCANQALSEWVDVTSREPQIVDEHWQVVLPASTISASIFYRLAK
jgi:beta-galactosidase